MQRCIECEIGICTHAPHFRGFMRRVLLLATDGGEIRIIEADPYVKEDALGEQIDTYLANSRVVMRE